MCSDTHLCSYCVRETVKELIASNMKQCQRNNDTKFTRRARNRKVAGGGRARVVIPLAKKAARGGPKVDVSSRKKVQRPYACRYNLRETAHR